MSASIVEQFLTPLSKSDNEGIYRVVEELSRKAGIAMPKLYTSNGKHLMLEMMPAAALQAGDSAAILLNQGMCNDIIGGTINFAEHATIPDSLKGVIAHEMGHIKRGDMKWTGMGGIAKITPYACMAGAMAGLYLIRRHWADKEHEPDQDKKSEPLQPHQAAAMLDLPKEVKSPTLQTAKKIALYTVTAAAGLATGVFVARGMRHHMEYACDAFSKEIMGSGKPLADFLQKFSTLNEKVYEKMPEAYKGTFKTVLEAVQSLLHPPPSSRIERLTR